MSSMALLHTLSDALCKPLKSVEILPGGFEQWSEAGITNEFPFLLSDGHLGVPQKILYKLYVPVSSLFMESRRCNDVRNLLASTSIILLANSAHQTALNARKRLVKSGHLDAQSELSLFAAFMTGCRDCAKQSMVWHHRRWMLHHLSSSSQVFHDLEYDLLDISVEKIRAELQLLSVCCESYPRNYYAWVHRTYCMDLLQKHVVANTPKSQELLIEDFASLLQWIDCHLSDYTAMHHLCKVVSLFQILGCETIQFRTLFNHAVSLISSYPEHEALWMYLRLVLCLVPLEQRHEMVTEITASALGAREEDKRLISYLGKVHPSVQVLASLPIQLPITSSSSKMLHLSIIAFIACMHSIVLAAPVHSEAQVQKRTFSGEATYFVVGLGACGDTSVSTDYVVALASADYGDGEYCDQTVVITDTSSGTSTTATVKDKCPSCASGDLDMSEGLFDFFKGSTEDGVFDITWEFSSDSSSSSSSSSDSNSNNNSDGTNDNSHPDSTPTTTSKHGGANPDATGAGSPAPAPPAQTPA
ncbi:hypothetical protein CPB85DRAFT_1436282 [Mucidula mucida]|nr:hypothetical protein CPB85DRAFT_1436282 [Mucidula mucida]